MAPNDALDAVCLLPGRRWNKMGKCIVVRIVPWEVPVSVDGFRLIVSMLGRGVEARSPRKNTRLRKGSSADA